MRHMAKVLKKKRKVFGSRPCKCSLTRSYLGSHQRQYSFGSAVSGRCLGVGFRLWGLGFKVRCRVSGFRV